VSEEERKRIHKSTRKSLFKTNAVMHKLRKSIEEDKQELARLKEKFKKY